ncbi:MAG TPA: arsenate reductase ArsC [Vicinamibacterales bacterium]|jgi:arsenate reductase
MAGQLVLFACVHNAGRSQMAAALFNALVDPARARALSAGTKPGPVVHPEVAMVMREIGIDLSSATPRQLTDDLAGRATLLITMGCGEQCPYVPGVERSDWALADPKGRPVEEVRAIRDDIRSRVAALIEARGWQA